jgi:hypothetical protein
MMYVLPNFLGNIMPKDLGRQIFLPKSFPVQNQWICGKERPWAWSKGVNESPERARY